MVRDVMMTRCPLFVCCLLLWCSGLEMAYAGTHPDTLSSVSAPATQTADVHAAGVTEAASVVSSRAVTTTHGGETTHTTGVFDGSFTPTKRKIDDGSTPTTPVSDGKVDESSGSISGGCIYCATIAIFFLIFLVWQYYN